MRVYHRPIELTVKRRFVLPFAGFAAEHDVKCLISDIENTIYELLFYYNDIMMYYIILSLDMEAISITI